MSLSAWECVEYISIVRGVMGRMGEDRGCLALGKLLCAVLGAGAGAKRRRAKPVGPAGEVSCESRGGRSSGDASRGEPRRPVM